MMTDGWTDEQGASNPGHEFCGKVRNTNNVQRLRAEKKVTYWHQWNKKLLSFRALCTPPCTRLHVGGGCLAVLHESIS